MSMTKTLNANLSTFNHWKYQMSSYPATGEVMRGLNTPKVLIAPSYRRPGLIFSPHLNVHCDRTKKWSSDRNAVSE